MALRMLFSTSRAGPLSLVLLGFQKRAFVAKSVCPCTALHPKVGPPGQLLEPVNRSLDFDQDRSRDPVPSAARLARNVEMTTLRLLPLAANCEGRSSASAQRKSFLLGLKSAY